MDEEVSCALSRVHNKSPRRRGKLQMLPFAPTMQDLVQGSTKSPFDPNMKQVSEVSVEGQYSALSCVALVALRGLLLNPELQPRIIVQVALQPWEFLR